MKKKTEKIKETKES